MPLPVLLVVLGLATAGWSGFLWWQLVRARDGFDTLCVGGSGCSALWDGGFASAVHGFTGLPVAGWGVVWGLVAAWAAGWLLTAQAADVRRQLGTLAWVALAGLAGVVVLVAAVFAAGEFCGNCAIVYGLVLAWVGAAAWRLRGTMIRLTLGDLGPPLLALGALWLGLLWPGLATPKTAVADSSPLVANTEAADGEHAGHDHAGHDHADHEHGEAPSGPSNAEVEEALRITSEWPPSDAVIRERLTALSAFLDPRAREQIGELFQQIAAASAPASLPSPRALHGPADAGVQITEFTDTLCGHCAQLFMELKLLDSLLPDEAFSIDSRHYPLDHRCNPQVAEVELDGRCEGAAARICLEASQGRFEYEELLYRNQRQLDPAAILELASPWVAKATLEACMVSPETQAKLREDTAFAAQYGIRGTPLVLIDGRQVPAFLPAIYALILTGGNAEHPALEALIQGPA